MKLNEFIGIICSYFFLTLFILCLFFGIASQCKTNKEQTSSPVKENRIDSISLENAKVIIIIDSLDKVKNEKVLEVKTLDNDSTLKLFYELLRK